PETATTGRGSGRPGLRATSEASAASSTRRRGFRGWASSSSCARRRSAPATRSTPIFRRPPRAPPRAARCSSGRARSSRPARRRKPPAPSRAPPSCSPPAWSPRGPRTRPPRSSGGTREVLRRVGWTGRERGERARREALAAAAVDALAAARPRLLAQLELLDLAGRGLGQLPELDGLRALEVREPLAAEGDQLVLRDAGARPQRNEGLRHLAPALVRHRHHRALEHGGMLHERVLDLDRGDVLAAPDDDVLLAVAQLDVAVRVHDAEVARVEPAALEGPRGRLGVLVVALHHVVAAHHHLAERSAVGGDVGHAIVDDAKVGRVDARHTLA